jgi:oligopeptide/dipeptide ABC transporter ATP-binding protein
MEKTDPREHMPQTREHTPAGSMDAAMTIDTGSSTGLGGHLLEVHNLSVLLGRPEERVAALSAVNLRLAPGEVLGVVGESGGGKSTLAKAVVGILPEGSLTSGEVLFEGRNVLTMRDVDLRRHHGGSVALCFQNPRDALNPTRRVGSQLSDRLSTHRGLRGAAAEREALAMLESVGIRSPKKRLRTYPHELSGGMCQRVMIGLSLACSPKMLIADEPTTGLDVTLTQEILALIRAAATEQGRAVMIISHDLAALAASCDRIAVLYAGQIIEEGEVEAVICRSAHPYTRALLDAVPDVSGMPVRAIPGTMPTLREPPSNCPFAPRCTMAEDRCRSEVPPDTAVASAHRAACFFAEEIEADSHAAARHH